jgi:TetR/AcrR family transcriptional regulator, cholesterol catabolism regulator
MISSPPDPLSPREVIVEAAVKLFGKQGYTGTTMRDIAKAVGILPGSLYAHINSKETLLDEIVESGIESFLAIESSLPSGTSASAEERLRAAIKAHVAIATGSPERSLVVFHQWRYLDEPNLSRALNKRRRYQQIFRKLVDEGMASGVFSTSLDPRIAVFAILGALNWTPEWYSPTGRAKAAEIGERLADTLLGGLVAEKS